MSNITLQSLIKEQKKRIKLLQNRVAGDDISDYYPDMQAYYDWEEITQRFLDLHFKGDKYTEKFCKLCDESFSLVQQKKLLAILKAFDAFPITIKNDVQMKNKEKANFVVNVTNNNSQSQNQDNRQLAVITESDKELVKPRSGIMSKLKARCFAIVTNIFVDVLSNITLWQWLHSQLELIIGRLLF